MTEDDIEAVAAELAKAGGVSWHSGPERGPLKLVMDRYRDRARVAIAALDRMRAAKQGVSPNQKSGEPLERGGGAELKSGSNGVVSVGSMVLYRPPGERRAYQCRVEKLDGSRAYLVPEITTSTGWVDLHALAPATQ